LLAVFAIALQSAHAFMPFYPYPFFPMNAEKYPVWIGHSPNTHPMQFQMLDRSEPPAAPLFNFKVTKSFPHNTDSFTQGLLFVNNELVEGTGLYGKSKLLKVNLENGEAIKSKDLDQRMFGEGVGEAKGKLFQLTWKERTMFVYDSQTWEEKGQFKFPSHWKEGWGLTSDGNRLIMADSTDKLYFVDPDTGKETGSLSVKDGNKPVEFLNELEFVEGDVWANIYGSDFVAVIDPSNGVVKRWVDFSKIMTPEERSQLPGGAVFNGIAYNPSSHKMYVTGKLWPKIFEVEIDSKPVDTSNKAALEKEQMLLQTNQWATLVDDE